MYALVVCVVGVCGFWFFFFFNQKTAYEMRISDWSSDVCSSDLHALVVHQPPRLPQLQMDHPHTVALVPLRQGHDSLSQRHVAIRARRIAIRAGTHARDRQRPSLAQPLVDHLPHQLAPSWCAHHFFRRASLMTSFSRTRSEEHTSELQSLMRISYAVFCLKK